MFVSVPLALRVIREGEYRRELLRTAVIHMTSRKRFPQCPYSTAVTGIISSQREVPLCFRNRLGAGRGGSSQALRLVFDTMSLLTAFRPFIKDSAGTLA